MCLATPPPPQVNYVPPATQPKVPVVGTNPEALKNAERLASGGSSLLIDNKSITTPEGGGGLQIGK